MIHWTIHLKGGLKECYHAAVVVRHKLYTFGGICSLIISDPIEVHIFNTVSLRWRKVTNGRGNGPIEVPSGRYGHTAVLVEEIVYIWGGRYPYCNVLYAFDADTHSWFKPNISGTIPLARTHHSACGLEKLMYVYGGHTQLSGYTNDLYKLDTSIMVWSLINTRGTPPAASHGHSATIIGTNMFVFGGCVNDSPHYNSIRVFDTETNCWLNKPSAKLLPEGRWGHSAFAYNGELYITGGWNGNTFFNNLQKFSPETFSWKQVKPKRKDRRDPRPKWMCGMCCCMVGDCIVIHGGGRGHNPIYDAADDLYILDLSPSLKTLCKLAVTQHGLDRSELPHDIRWELASMTANSNRRQRRRTL